MDNSIMVGGRLFATVVFVLLLAGCPTEEKQTPQEQPDQAFSEEIDEITGQFGSARQIIRREAQVYIEKEMPQYNVEGVATTSFTGNLYFVGVDVISGDERKTVNLLARRFYPVSSTSLKIGKNQADPLGLFEDDPATPPYWKVEPLTPELSRALSGYAVKKLEKETEFR